MASAHSEPVSVDWDGLFLQPGQSFSRSYPTKASSFQHHIFLEDLSAGATIIYNFFVRSLNDLPRGLFASAWTATNIKERLDCVFKMLLHQIEDAVVSEQDGRRASYSRRLQRVNGGPVPHTPVNSYMRDSAIRALTSSLLSLQTKYRRGQIRAATLHERKGFSAIYFAGIHFNDLGPTSPLSRLSLSRPRAGATDSSPPRLPPADSEVTLRILQKRGLDIILTYTPHVPKALQEISSVADARRYQILFLPGIGKLHFTPEPCYVMREHDLEPPFDILACDPGVKIFATCFLMSTGQLFESNDHRFGDTMHAFQKRCDSLQRALSFPALSAHSRATLTASFQKSRRGLHNLVSETHHVVCADMVRLASHILLPRFSTSSMLRRNGPKGPRVINSTVARDMTDQRHYAFRTFMHSYVRFRPGRNIITVDEAYTTSACHACGRLNNVGGSRTFHCRFFNVTAPRDGHAACNILLKTLIDAHGRHKDARSADAAGVA